MPVIRGFDLTVEVDYGGYRTIVLRPLPKRVRERFTKGSWRTDKETRSMARRNRPPRPLSCYNCGEEKRLRVSGATQERKVGNRDGSRTRRRVANVECKNCGQEWLSRHPEALALADKHDLARERRHGRQKQSV